MTTQEQLDQLTSIVKSLAASVVHHDDVIEVHNQQIGNLISLADKHWAEIVELRRSMAETDRLWQAYLKRLPPQ